MSAMPERVQKYLCAWEGGLFLIDEGFGPDVFVKHNDYAALESRMLAAEARVREMEEQASRPVPLDYGRHPITDARRDFIHHALTYPGFVGNRDLFVEAARDLAAEAAALRAECDALVPLARLGLWAYDEHQSGGGLWDDEFRDKSFMLGIHVGFGRESEATTQARAILSQRTNNA